MREIATHTDFIGLVREQVRVQLADGAPTLSKIARVLGLSARTLQRRLDDRGSSFHDLVDGVRQDLALFYLAGQDRPLGEIAYLCGYSELSGFLRAFRRWTGKTPSEYRAR